ncbi:putative E3 ubiquitin-protein ligase RING1a [Bidens hawaiensis]|uniref:putative E3 ubiquitin-protein ligase RING1a n=1 Tax=Bidens hawaiensis TaxID=980011 RepID=UPI00404AB487
MPAHKHPASDDVDLQRNNQNDAVEQQPPQESDDDNNDDDGSSSASDDEEDEFVYVKLADIRDDVQCPICLGIIRKTRKVMECLHRFCRECIDKSMRLGNNECPACRAHCASRRSLRDDPNFDALIAFLYPDIDGYEAAEAAFSTDEKARNKQIQASSEETSRRQLEALGKKKAAAKATENAYVRRSQSTTRNLRRRKRRRSIELQDSENEVDADNGNEGKDSSSTDEAEPATEVKLIRYKRSGGANVGRGDNKPEGSRKPVGGPVAPENLAWGGGGMRSHTRHGGGQGGAGKSAKNSQQSKLIHHLQNLPKNDDELDINLALVSLNKQCAPNLQSLLHVCCKPTMTTTNIRQYVASKNGLQADEIELLVVKDIIPISLSSVTAAELVARELQLLEGHRFMSDVAKNSSQINLTIAYRKKSFGA